MQFKSSLQAVATILAFSGLTSAFPQPPPSGDAWPAETSLTPDVAGAMATFWQLSGEWVTNDPSVDYPLLTFTAVGVWGQCYTFPRGWGIVGSVKLRNQTLGCWVYPWNNWNCAGNDFWPIDAPPTGTGENRAFGQTAGSYQCLQWTN